MGAIEAQSGVRPRARGLFLRFLARIGPPEALLDGLREPWGPMMAARAYEALWLAVVNAHADQAKDTDAQFAEWLRSFLELPAALLAELQAATAGDAIGAGPLGALESDAREPRSLRWDVDAQMWPASAEAPSAEAAALCLPELAAHLRDPQRVDDLVWLFALLLRGLLKRYAPSEPDLAWPERALDESRGGWHWRAERLWEVALQTSITNSNLTQRIARDLWPKERRPSARFAASVTNRPPATRRSAAPSPSIRPTLRRELPSPVPATASNPGEVKPAARAPTPVSETREIDASTKSRAADDAIDARHGAQPNDSPSPEVREHPFAPSPPTDLATDGGVSPHDAIVLVEPLEDALEPAMAVIFAPEDMHSAQRSNTEDIAMRRALRRNSRRSKWLSLGLGLAFIAALYVWLFLFQGATTP